MTLPRSPCLGASVFLLGCQAPPAAPLPQPASISALILDDAGAPAARVPASATCVGGGRAPALAWGAPPAGAADVLVVARAAAGPVHWLVWGLDPAAEGLPSGLVAHQAPPLQGINDAGIIGWLPPCQPPSPPEDRLVLDLYVLSAPLLAPPTLGAEAIVARAGPLVIAAGRHNVPMWGAP